MGGECFERARAAAWTNGLVWTFVAARIAHMLAYYADQRTLRSTVFTVGVIALLGLLVVTATALL